MSTVGLQRQYNGLIKDINKNEKAKLSRRIKKLALLKEELDSVQSSNWPAVIDKKMKQLEIIEDRFKQLRQKGIIKPWKLGRKLSDHVDPKIGKLFKLQKRISLDLDSLRANHHEFYKKQMLERLSKSEAKLKQLESGIDSLDFQMQTLPVVTELVSQHAATTPALPWCVTNLLEPSNAAPLLALTSSAPPFHMLDQPQRVYLNADNAVASQTVAQEPAKSKPFSFAQARKTAANAITLPKTDDLTTQLMHIKHLVPLQPSNYCKICQRITEWSKDEKHGYAVCVGCSFAKSIATSCKESFYGTDIDIVEPFHYEKRGQFIKCLRQRQAKQLIMLPPSVLDSVRSEILRLQILDPHSLRPKHLRKILKRLGLSNYYDHDVLIWSMVTGTKPPRFTDAQETELISMFDTSLKSYLKHKGARNNYLTYSFAIHKMLEILGWDPEIREFYPVLKSDSKREAQEMIFHNMCRDMDWPIHKTMQQFINEAKFSF